MSEKKYYYYLFEIKEKMRGKSFLDMSKIWKKEYSSIELGHPIPKALALCHKDFWINWEGQKFKLNEEGWGEFEVPNCQFEKISGIECPWNPNPENMERDHWWPKSLGGPYSGHNLLGLCKVHNLAKGNGIRGYDWSEKPQWLDSRLKEISEKKLFGIQENNF